jgi:DNA invertase Pin-like site-specific DNA recombinase
MEAGVEFVAVDAPYANRLMIHILSAFAEHERMLISDRTRSALAAAKARGVQLGINGRVLADQRRAGAAAFAEQLREPVEHARQQGATTLLDFANSLIARSYKTRCGANWTPGTVNRLLQRLNLSRKQAGG